MGEVGFTPAEAPIPLPIPAIRHGLGEGVVREELQPVAEPSLRLESYSVVGGIETVAEYPHISPSPYIIGTCSVEFIIIFPPQPVGRQVQILVVRQLGSSRAVVGQREYGL